VNTLAVYARHVWVKNLDNTLQKTFMFKTKKPQENQISQGFVFYNENPNQEVFNF
jgi:hypothetical protein